MRLIDIHNIGDLVITINGVQYFKAEDIYEQSTVDAAEIIMCKDCIRINTDDCPWNTKEYHMGTTDFCSWGEREDYLLNKERYRGCDTCKNNDLEWYEEPCDSCTVGGKNDHYEVKNEQQT